MTDTGLAPDLSALAPAMLKVAAASSVIALTTTEVVPAATVMVSEAATAAPLTVRLASELLLLKGVT